MQIAALIPQHSCQVPRRLPRLKIKHCFHRAMLRLLAPDDKRLLILIEPEAVRNQSCRVEPLLCHQPQIDLHGGQKRCQTETVETVSGTLFFQERCGRIGSWVGCGEWMWAEWFTTDGTGPIFVPGCSKPAGERPARRAGQEGPRLAVVERVRTPLRK